MPSRPESPKEEPGRLGHKGRVARSMPSRIGRKVAGELADLFQDLLADWWPAFRR